MILYIPDHLPLKDQLALLEKQLMRKALERSDWSVKVATAKSEMSESSFRRVLRKHKITNQDWVLEACRLSK